MIGENTGDREGIRHDWEPVPRFAISARAGAVALVTASAKFSRARRSGGKLTATPFSYQLQFRGNRLTGSRPGPHLQRQRHPDPPERKSSN